MRINRVASPVWQASSVHHCSLSPQEAGSILTPSLWMKGKEIWGCFQAQLSRGNAEFLGGVGLGLWKCSTPEPKSQPLDMRFEDTGKYSLAPAGEAKDPGVWSLEKQNHTSTSLTSPADARCWAGRGEQRQGADWNRVGRWTGSLRSHL